jgi:hypothetical protein
MRKIALRALWILPVAALATMAARAAGGETRVRVQDWGLDVITAPLPQAAPGDFAWRFRVEAGRGKVIGRSPSLYGPVFVSSANSEIFSCEGNGVGQGEGAIVFDRNGRIQDHLEHVGPLKACGITANGRLYWLHYVLPERGHYYSLVRFVGAGGLPHGERRLDEAGTAHFRDDDGQAYTVEIGPPVPPASVAAPAR